MPKNQSINTVLVIGSGPIIIGQAAEFDYAGTQACLTLKEAGNKVILINNNPATIMTDEQIADVVYFEPLTIESIEKIIKKEKPDGLLATVSGQTGLNLAFDLSDKGIIDKYNLTVLGTTIDSIMRGEDRDKFKRLMNEIDEPIPESEIIANLTEAKQFSERVSFPIIIRPAYTLGGSGGGIATNDSEFEKLVTSGLRASPINQCLIEKSIAGWKEIEMEVIRDNKDNCVVVCHMENIDPVGIHTGDSVVVSPVQTLNDDELTMLKKASKKIVSEVGIVGACNVQLAINPNTNDYFVIEINPRVSRSSALASKATGYPIAKIATKLSLGFSLDEIIDQRTGKSLATYEPDLNYTIVKFPRFPFDKFKNANRFLGTQMKATGEVMAVGNNLKGAIQKGIRSLELNINNLFMKELKELSNAELKTLISTADDRRFFALFEAFDRQFSIDEIHDLTQINHYFLREIAELVELNTEMLTTDINNLSKESLLVYKQAGFTDQSIANNFKSNLTEIKELRTTYNIYPEIKQVNAMSDKAELAACYYTTWNNKPKQETSSNKDKVLIIGSGPIRIGQGVEFDYCSVQSILELQKNNYETVLINNNPSTVSTDFEIADKLYFEPITVEDVLNIIEIEQIENVFIQFGGQTSINLASGLEAAGINLIGTSNEAINQLEDRDLFYQFMKDIDLPHIPGQTVNSRQDLKAKVTQFGYPVLLRPSFVIGGQGMIVLKNEEDLNDYLTQIKQTNIFPILIDAYYPGQEIEVDVLTDNNNILIPGIFEHLELAGVHSGDSMAVTPPVNLSNEIKEKVVAYAKKIAIGAKFKGLFNIQFVNYEGELYVLEVNPRASRTVPVMSKITQVNMVGLAVQLILGKTLSDCTSQINLMDEKSFYTIKAPVFSTHKLPGVDPKLVPEMKSTGELIATDNDYEVCLKKAFIWNEPLSKQFKQTKKEIYIAKEFNYFSEYHELFKILNIELIYESEIKDIAEWCKRTEAFAIYSDKESSMERNHGLIYNLMVISAKETLEALAHAKITTKDILSIDETNKVQKKEGIFI